MKVDTHLIADADEEKTNQLHIDSNKDKTTIDAPNAQKQKHQFATAVYTGKIEDNVPHDGEGELLLDGVTYKGNWKRGRLDEAETLNQ